MAKPKTHDQAPLRIGAVARLTGLSAHNLRKWEERYAAVKPQRTGSGERLYSRDDVRRLVLIKRLSSAGVPIGEVARSSLEDLERICENTLDESAAISADSAHAQSIRVAIIGPSLSALGGPGGAQAREIDVVLRSDDLASAQQKLAGQVVDIVVLDCPTVHDGTGEVVERAKTTLGARGAMVVYGFGARVALDALRRGGVLTLRSPIDSGEFHRAAASLMHEINGNGAGLQKNVGLPAHSDVPPPRFSQDVVARIVTMAPSIKCECPHHLAQIIISLRAFEQYSAECENQSPEDAELHHYLKAVAGRSRASFEEALARVAEAEGFYLTD